MIWVCVKRIAYAVAVVTPFIMWKKRRPSWRSRRVAVGARRTGGATAGSGDGSVMDAAHTGGPRASPARRALAYGAAEVDKAGMAADAPEGRIRLTHIMYGLHGFSAFMGLVSTAAIVTAFLTGWPSLI